MEECLQPQAEIEQALLANACKHRASLHMMLKGPISVITKAF